MMASTLIDLGLGGAEPFLVQACERFQSRLHGGEEIGAWKAPPLRYSEPD